MKAKDIKSIEQAEHYCEGVLNDLQEGLIDKSKAMKYFAEYTGHVMNMAWEKGANEAQNDAAREIANNYTPRQ